MKKYDEQAARVLQEWTERELRAAVGAKSRSDVQEVNEYEPRGPHRWFLESLAEASAISAMRQMSEAWKERPPYASWRSCAAAIRQKADEWVTNAMLPTGTTLAMWFAENEPLLQREPTNQGLIRVVAVALIPLFQDHPDYWDACEQLDDDTRGMFRDYLADWHSRVPEKHRPLVRRIAEEFGIDVERPE